MDGLLCWYNCVLCITLWDICCWGYLRFLALFRCLFISNLNFVNNREFFPPPPLFIVKDTAETWFSPGSSHSAQSHLQVPLSFSSSFCTLTPQMYSMSALAGFPSYRHTTHTVGGQRSKRAIFPISSFRQSRLWDFESASHVTVPYILQYHTEPDNYRQPARRHPTYPAQHQRFPPREICKVVPSNLRNCWQ